MLVPMEPRMIRKVYYSYGLLSKMNVQGDKFALRAALQLTSTQSSFFVYSDRGFRACKKLKNVNSLILNIMFYIK